MAGLHDFEQNPCQNFSPLSCGASVANRENAARARKVFMGAHGKNFSRAGERCNVFPVEENQSDVRVIESSGIACACVDFGVGMAFAFFFRDTPKMELDMQEKQGARGVEEAKAVLSDLAGLGVESVRSARQWLNHRRQDMQQRNQPEQNGYRTNGQASYCGLGPSGYQRPDECIVDTLNERLAMDDEIDARDVNVTVNAGVVTLDGEVADRWQRYRADDIAESCYGVRQVENRLRVRELANSADADSV